MEIMEKYSEELLSIIEELKVKANKNKQRKSLNSLFRNFNHWKKKTIDSETLVSHIKEWCYVNVENTGYTQGADPGLPVAQALADGSLKEKDIPPELLSKLELLIEIMKV